MGATLHSEAPMQSARELATQFRRLELCSAPVSAGSRLTSKTL
jgi:hypothetical protein